jgi:hypothetical protein
MWRRIIKVYLPIFGRILLPAPTIIAMEAAGFSETTISKRPHEFTLHKIILLDEFPLHSQLNNSMTNSPSWEAKGFSASQKISVVIWKLKVCYRGDKVYWAGSIQSTLLLPSLKKHFNIIFPSYWGLPSGLFPSAVTIKILNAPLLFSIRATCLAYLTHWLDGPLKVCKE